MPSELTLYRVVHKFDILSKKCKVYKKCEYLDECIAYAKYLENEVGNQFLVVQSYNINRCPSWCTVDGWRYETDIR